MAATPLTPVAAPGCYANPIDVSGVASNTGGGGNTVVMSGNDALIVYNTTASPGTITITSAPDALGRSQDISAFVIAASKVYFWGPIKQAGWMNASGQLVVTASATTIQLAVVRLG